MTAPMPVTCRASYEPELGRWRLATDQPSSPTAAGAWLSASLGHDVTLLADAYGDRLELLVDDAGRRDRLTDDAATIVELFASRQPIDIDPAGQPVRQAELWRRLALTLDATRDATGSARGWAAAEAQATRRRLGLHDDPELFESIRELGPRQHLDSRVVNTAAEVVSHLGLDVAIDAGVPSAQPSAGRAGTPNGTVWLHRSFVADCPLNLSGPCAVERHGDSVRVAIPLQTDRYASEVRGISLGAFSRHGDVAIALAPLTVDVHEGDPAAVAYLTVGGSRTADQLDLVMIDEARPSPSAARRELEAIRFAERQIATALRLGEPDRARRWSAFTPAGFPERTSADAPLVSDGLLDSRRR